METQKITAPDAQPYDRFGIGVAVSGDVAVVGAAAHWSQYSRGVAYVLRYDGSGWVEEARLAPSVRFSGFGVSDAIAISGDRILLGAPQDSTLGSSAGSAYVFRYDGSDWVEEARLFASDGAAGDSFGAAVALSGDIALVRARTEQAESDLWGSVYLFRFDGEQWLEYGKLVVPEREAHDAVGLELALQGGNGILGADEKVYLVDLFQTVGVDIWPGQDPNRIDPLSPVPVRVAVLGAPDFDVRDIVTGTLRFGPGGARPLDGHSPVFDANRDGFRDLVSLFPLRDAGIAFGDSTACVQGETDAGLPFRGCDAIEVSSYCGGGFGAAVLLLPAIAWLGRRGRGTAHPPRSG